MSKTKVKPKKITTAELRKKAFAEHIAAGKSATQAARLVGFKGTRHGVEVQGSRMLKNVEVQKYIAEIAKAATTSRVATAEQIREFWTEVLVGKAIDNGLPPKLSDRIKAAELLAKVQGMFVEKVENKGELTITIRRGADAAASLPAGGK
jgi:phage terminase small subunit